jgi:hypothetical protein
VQHSTAQHSTAQHSTSSAALTCCPWPTPRLLCSPVLSCKTPLPALRPALQPQHVRGHSAAAGFQHAGGGAGPAWRGGCQDHPTGAHGLATLRPPTCLCPPHLAVPPRLPLCPSPPDLPSLKLPTAAHCADAAMTPIPTNTDTRLLISPLCREPPPLCLPVWHLSWTVGRVNT